MKTFFWLVLILVGAAPVVRAQDAQSCGPKSALCWPQLNRGASGPRVVALQYLLLSRGYKLAPDGKFAFVTENAVRQFQRKNKLQIDGKVGWQSWEAITPNLKRGAKGNAVRALQTLLAFQKQKVARDGFFGGATQRALNVYAKPEEIIGLGDDVTDLDWCYLSGGNFTESD